MKILLSNLPTEGEVRDYTTREYLLNDYTKYPPLGLLAIAADVNPKHSIKVLDTVVKNLSIENTVQHIIDHNPDVLGLSVVTRRLYALHVISRRIREALPHTRIVAGGPHINHWPEETIRLESLDYVLAGCGEKTFPLLVDAMENGNDEEQLAGIANLHYRSPDGQIQATPAQKMPTILDSLPFPDRSLTNLNDYYTAVDQAQMTTMYSSRGCPFHCIYCDVQQKEFSYRTAKSVVDEFEEIASLGITEIHIFDDTFNLRPQRVKDICNDILQRGLKVRWSARARVSPFDDDMMVLLKKAGCKRLHVGVESLDPNILKYMNKKQTPEQIRGFFKLCQEHNMETLAYFIIGFPDETREYREGLLKEVTKLGATYAFCNILSPLPRTRYYESLLEDGTFKEDYWAAFVANPTRDFELPLPRSPQLQRELEAVADDFHKRFCYRLDFILKEFRKSITSPRMLSVKAKLALSLLFHSRHSEVISR